MGVVAYRFAQGQGLSGCSGRRRVREFKIGVADLEVVVSRAIMGRYYCQNYSGLLNAVRLDNDLGERIVETVQRSNVVSTCYHPETTTSTLCNEVTNPSLCAILSTRRPLFVRFDFGNKSRHPIRSVPGSARFRASERGYRFCFIQRSNWIGGSCSSS